MKYVIRVCIFLLCLFPVTSRAGMVSITIEKTDAFTAIRNPNVYPGDGRYFVGLLVAIQNNSKQTINGGGSDSSHQFQLETANGYTAPAENTSSRAWREDRMVWAVNEILPGEKKKGWLVFSIPTDDRAKKLVFSVDEVTGPYQSRFIGYERVDLR